MLRVAVSDETRRADGGSVFDLSLLQETPGTEWRLYPGGRREVLPADVQGCFAALVWAGRITEKTVAGAHPPLLIARLGAGYDAVDIEACTRSGVVVTTAPDGVRRPLASGAMALVLAVAHRIRERDREVRNGVWSRFSNLGVGLTGRSLGLIGLGNVGREIAALAQPFGMVTIAHDPHVPAAPAGVELVSVETVMRESDFVVIVCSLTEETRGLVGEAQLRLMKPSAFLVNVARGPIVDQAALTSALQERRIAGAALDVFAQEPIGRDDPLLELENVILSPHAIGISDEMVERCGQSASRSVLSLFHGGVPECVVNPTALQHPRVKGWLASRNPVPSDTA